MKGAYLCKMKTNESKDWYPRKRSRNQWICSFWRPEVLIRTFRGLSLSWSSCSLRSFSTKTVFGVDYMSLIIHHLDSIGEITTSVPLQWMINLAGGCKGSGGWNVGILRRRKNRLFFFVGNSMNRFDFDFYSWDFCSNLFILQKLGGIILIKLVK